MFVFQWLENTVWKGENATYKHFFLIFEIGLLRGNESTWLKD